MKQILYLSYLLVFTMTLLPKSYSQQYDRYWMGINWHFELTEVMMRFDENAITYHVINLPEKIHMDRGILAISNAAGELQFYTNGNVVVSWDHKVMEGGKGFNQGATNDDFLSTGGWGDPDTTYNIPYNPYTYRIIPDSEDENIYYMVHAFVIEHGECTRIDVPRMQISKIDMSDNGGKGKVVYKNRYFDEELVGAGFALVRHGNGRDWWVALRKHDGLAYRSLLLHRDSVLQVVESAIPGLSTDWFSWEDCFQTSLCLLESSLDGSRLLDKYGEDGAKLLAFDRCSGEVSLLDTFATGIVPLMLGPPSYLTIDCSITTFQFSPSGRYLYGAGAAEFAQWDLDAADIGASKVKLGGVPWALNDDQTVMVGSRGGFTVFAPGPDGKIYNLMRTAHSVIHHPDEKGEDSDLCLAADNAPVSCLGPDVPYYLFSGRHANYRLGPLTGSACDTIPTSVHEPPANGGYALTASPTLASGPVEVAITLPAYGSASAAELLVVDMLGRALHRHRFPPYAYLHRFDVGGWPAGLYNIVLLDKGRARASARLVVAR